MDFSQSKKIKDLNRKKVSDLITKVISIIRKRLGRKVLNIVDYPDTMPLWVIFQDW